MRTSFDRPTRRSLDLPRQIEIANAIVCGLRRGVGGSPILLEQFDGYCRSRAKIVIGGAHVEMKFAGIVLVADIAIEAANGRC